LSVYFKAKGIKTLYDYQEKHKVMMKRLILNIGLKCGLSSKQA